MRITVYSLFYIINRKDKTQRAVHSRIKNPTRLFLLGVSDLIGSLRTSGDAQEL